MTRPEFEQIIQEHIERVLKLPRFNKYRISLLKSRRRLKRKVSVFKK